MTMTRLKVIIYGFMIASVITSLSFAANCSVTLDKISDVGATETLSGKAEVPPGFKLWLFAHRKGLALWWPQGGGSANISNNGAYQVLVYFGETRDVGSEFEVTARVVDTKVNAILEEWVRRAASTNVFPAIPMPDSLADCGVTFTATRDH